MDSGFREVSAERSESPQVPYCKNEDERACNLETSSASLIERIASTSLVEMDQRVRIMLHKELQCLAHCDYIENVQKDGMRRIWRSKVINWLLEFEDEFGISQDTIAVAVNYLDRYLSQVSTKKSILQLLAMGCIFIAGKLHETFPIGMNELRDLADGAYLESDIKLMELELLRVLRWQLNPVTPQAFMTNLVQYIEGAEVRRALMEDAVTFLDVVLPEYEILKFKPSVQGTAALLCAFETTRMDMEVVRNWADSVSKFGILDNREVVTCKELMLHIFDSMVLNRESEQFNVDASTSSIPSLASNPQLSDSGERFFKVVSPVGVEELPCVQDENNSSASATQVMGKVQSQSQEGDALRQHGVHH